MTLSTQDIAFFIEEDKKSDVKREARSALKYYHGEHDIRNYRLFYYDGEGNIKEDTDRSNIKISHPFFTELVDQQAQYMLSGERLFVAKNDEELQEELDEYFDDEFRSELMEMLTGVIAKGFDYMYMYKGSDDKIRFQAADGLNVIEVRAKDTDDNADYVIYHFMDRQLKDGKEIRRIQVWSDKETYFYIMDGDDKIFPDQSVPLNPRPHVVFTRDNDDALYSSDLGQIPFFRLDNNPAQKSNLAPIKGLIDDYDLMSCGLSNNIQDMVEGVYVVKGFQGDNMDELIHNVKTKKHIGVDEGGDLDIKTVDIPVEARKTKLELNERNIYKFGMGLNSSQVGDGNVTNVVIKSRYALLDLKCNKLEFRLRSFLRKLLAPVLDEINSNKGTAYTVRDVDIHFEREIMTNALDNAQIAKLDAETEQIRIDTLVTLASTVGQDEVLKGVCDVLGLDYDEVKKNLPDDPTVAQAEEIRAAGEEPEQVQNYLKSMGSKKGSHVDARAE